jgi:hypothetical protein
MFPVFILEMQEAEDNGCPRISTYREAVSTYYRSQKTMGVHVSRIVARRQWMSTYSSSPMGGPGMQEAEDNGCPGVLEEAEDNGCPGVLG